MVRFLVYDMYIRRFQITKKEQQQLKMLALDADSVKNIIEAQEIGKITKYQMGQLIKRLLIYNIVQIYEGKPLLKVAEN